jgi:hypothetical protein
MASKIIVDQIESSGSNITIPTGTGLVVTDGIAATNLSGTIADARLPTVPVAKGGTGLTSLGSAGQVVQVNSGANALEFATASSGGLVDTKFVTFQGTQTHAGNSFADVTDLTITHTCSNSSNKIILMAHIGSLMTLGSSSNTLSGSSAFAFSVDSSRPASMMGTPASSRVGVITRNGSHGVNQDHGPGGIFLQGVHSPGDTNSHTYKVQVLCQSGEYALIGKSYSDNDSNNSYGSRASCTLQLLEVSV